MACCGRWIPCRSKNGRRSPSTISDAGEISRDHPLLASPDEWAGAADEEVSLDEVRLALSTIRGSLSEAIIDERRDR
jgi:hypothetical protein